MPREIDRRRFVKGTSIAALAGLAGCSTSSNGGQGTSGDGQDGSSEGSQTGSSGGEQETSVQGNGGGKQVLRFSALSLDPLEEEVVKKFRDGTEWGLEVMELPNTSYKDALGTWLGGSQAPDVYFYWAGPARAGTFVAQGNALKLNDYVEQEYLDGFYQSALNQEKYKNGNIFAWRQGDDIWGLPMTHTPYALWYNKKVLDNVGIDHSGWENKTDMTVDEFNTVCQKVKDAGHTAFTSGNKGQWNFLYNITWALTKHAGAETYVNTALNRNDTPWTADVYVEALTFLQDWADKYLIDAANGLSDQESATLFFDGRAAFSAYGMWMQENMREFAPDSFKPDDMGFMWWPYFPDKYSAGKNERVGGGGDGYQLSVTAEERGRAEMGATFLTDYLHSTETAVSMASEPMANTPARKVWDQFDSLTYIQKLGKTAQEQLESAEATATVPDLVCPPQQSNAWLSGGQQLISGKDPAKILESVEKARQADIEKYG